MLMNQNWFPSLCVRNLIWSWSNYGEEKDENELKLAAFSTSESQSNKNIVLLRDVDHEV